MSVNIKFGNNTLEGVSTIRVQDADSEGQYDLFTVAPENTWTVTFVNNGETYSVQSVVKGDLIDEAPSYPMTANEIAIGWCSVDENPLTMITFPYKPTANITLYAYYADKNQLAQPVIDGLSDNNLYIYPNVQSATEYEVYNYNDPSNPVLLGSLPPMNDIFTLDIETDGVTLADDNPTTIIADGSHTVYIRIKADGISNWVPNGVSYNQLPTNGGCLTTLPPTSFNSSLTVSCNEYYVTSALATEAIIGLQAYFSGGDLDFNQRVIKLYISSSTGAPRYPKNVMDEFTYISGCTMDIDDSTNSGEIIQGTSDDGIFYLSLDKYKQNSNCTVINFALNCNTSDTFKIGLSHTLPQIGTSLIDAWDIYSSMADNGYVSYFDLADYSSLLTPDSDPLYLCIQPCNASDISNDVMKKFVSVWVGTYDEFDEQSFTLNGPTLKAAAEYSYDYSEDLNIYVKFNGSPTNEDDYALKVAKGTDGSPQFFDSQGNNMGLNQIELMNIQYFTYWTDPTTRSDLVSIMVPDGDISYSIMVGNGYYNYCQCNSVSGFITTLNSYIYGAEPSSEEEVIS